MQKKKIGFKTKGMNKDLSVSAYNPEFAFENMNLRLSTNEGNTLMSWVNEKGTLQMTVAVYVPEHWSKEGEADVYVDPEDESWTYHAAGYDPEEPVYGTPIGTAVINHKLVLFTTTTIVTPISTTIGTDYIYQFTIDDTDSDTLKGEKLFQGALNFRPTKPLETLISYEAEDIQKVYWVDGFNQPRVINLMDKNIGTEVVDSSYFDFVRELALNETVTVKKMLGANGMFAPGVIQYAFTYYTKHGQESNIFYTTPLYYISHKDRGAAPDEKVSNAFKITVSHLDMKFDYLRIYSIQRTSLNGTPICKRVRDIYLKDLNAATETINGTQVNYYVTSYTDDGMSGDSIDPTELLYKGGKAIIAETLEQKDNTLFLGNISMKYSLLSKDEKDTIAEAVSLEDSEKYIYSGEAYPTGAYKYNNQLTYFSDTNFTKSTPCGGFKRGDYYRCGVQFQHKDGEWSEPVFVEDFKITNTPSAGQLSGGSIVPYTKLPVISGTLTKAMADSLRNSDYIRIRPVVVFPEIKDRVALCQGVLSPTMYISSTTSIEPDVKDRQSSYFFRTLINAGNTATDGSTAPGGFGTTYGGIIQYAPFPHSIADVRYMRALEVEGAYGEYLHTDGETCSFHSPDVEFDQNLIGIDYTDTKYKLPGYVTIYKTLADIDIQTESPTISNGGGGFVHKTFVGDDMHGIVAGLFYDDYSVNEDDDVFKPTSLQKDSFKWLVYPWQADGSLNNDIIRPNSLGTATAVLKKKVISNLRFSENTSWNSLKKAENDYSTSDFVNDPQEFSSEEVSIIKIGDIRYQGNVDTMLQPKYPLGKFFAFDGDCSNPVDSTDDSPVVGWGILTAPNGTEFNSTNWWQTYATSEDGDTRYNGLYKRIVYNDSPVWRRRNSQPGDIYPELVIKKAGVRMKYKSTPHLLVKFGNDGVSGWSTTNIPLLEIVREETQDFIDGLFGGKSNDAFKENKWVPCGEPVRLDNIINIGTEQEPEYVVQFEYSYGDTYFQRWDCLKTYAFTREDINQVVEIGSFMLETRVNIDGRYDRNRGQQNNLNVSPQNFNLMNDVYSQVDNFFTYRIMSDEEEEISMYPNQITWSKTKESGSDTDLWTNLTLASVLEMDGDKGEVRKLIRLRNQLFAFQDRGIAQILYNDNVQIQSTQGVPIEIANSGKVSGKDYKSDTIGCTNKWSIVTTPSGIYFMDNITKSIYLFNGELKNISQLGGMDSWCKQNIPDVNWLPVFPDNDDSGFAAYYDQMNQDILFVNANYCLAWSEKLAAFTSFYSYQHTPYFCNLDSMGIWIKQGATTGTNLWKHRGGEYCRFFGENKPYWMTLIGNPEPQMDKIFTNLEFRASVEGDGELNSETGKFTPYLPFDSLDVENDYQHGITDLETRWGRTDGAMRHFDGFGTLNSLKRKFRIWRCDIPRSNATLPFGSRKTDRIRNPWVKMTLTKKVAVDVIDPQTQVVTEVTLPKAEIHDIELVYFI